MLEGRLPHVVMPGEAMGEVSPAAAARWGLPVGCSVVGGTTDSIAAFLASGARGEGDAVSYRGDHDVTLSTTSRGRRRGEACSADTPLIN